MSEQIKHTDARITQPLPWKLEQEDKCTNLMSVNDKHIATFWGNDERHPRNLEWCTESQRLKHAEFAVHACNYFGAAQNVIEWIYGMHGLPEEAIKGIEDLFSIAYFEGAPIYVGKLS